MKCTNLLLFLFIFSLFFTVDLYADSKNTQLEEKKSEVIKKDINKTQKTIQNNKSSEVQSRVFVDPETGKFIPREEAINRGIIIRDNFIFTPESVELPEVVETPLPGGGFKAKLPPSYSHTIKAGVSEKGDINTTCDHKEE